MYLVRSLPVEINVFLVLSCSLLSAKLQSNFLWQLLEQRDQKSNARSQS